MHNGDRVRGGCIRIGSDSETGTTGPLYSMRDSSTACNQFTHFEVAKCDIDADPEEPDRDIDSPPPDSDDPAKIF